MRDPPGRSPLSHEEALLLLLHAELAGVTADMAAAIRAVQGRSTAAVFALVAVSYLTSWIEPITPVRSSRSDLLACLPTQAIAQ